MELKQRIAVWAAGAALLLLAPSAAIPVRAEEQRQAQVVVDGIIASYHNPVLLDNGTYFLPVREFLEGLGYQVSWKENPGSIVAQKYGHHVLEITPGQSGAFVDSNYYNLNAAVKVVDSTAYMPSMPIMELMGYRVETDQYRAKIYFTSLVWERIQQTLASGEGYKLEGLGAGETDARKVRLYIDGELAFEGGWKNGQMSGGGRMYDNGRLVYEGGLAANKPEGPGIRYDTSGERYEGLFAGGLPQGQGLYFADDKLLYDGEWQYGRMWGNGKLYDKNNKPLFEGSFLKGVRQGYGVLFNSSTGKSVYEGNWSNDQRSGSGKAFNDDGKLIYNGNWANDKKDGKGKTHRYGKVKSYTLDGTRITSVEEVNVVYVSDVEYAEGILIKQADYDWAYRGEFLATGEVNGQGEAGRMVGTTTSEAGVLNRWIPHYKGEFRYGVMTGTGILYDEEGHAIYEGQVVDGLRNGTGSSFTSKGQLTYSGSWEGDKPDGKGWSYEYGGVDSSTGQRIFILTEVVYRKGEVASTGHKYRVTSSTAAGKGEGTGRQYWIYDGDQKSNFLWDGSSSTGGFLIYEGALYNGLREGQGVEYVPGGNKYTGSFKNNQRNGLGKLTMNDGYSYEGEFADNVMEGEGKLFLNNRLEYEGQFRNNKKNGRGTDFRANGSKEYEGEFWDGKRNGYGVLYDYAGKTVIYRGEFRNGEKLEN